MGFIVDERTKNKEDISIVNWKILVPLHNKKIKIEFLNKSMQEPTSFFEGKFQGLKYVDQYPSMRLVVDNLDLVLRQSNLTWIAEMVRSTSSTYSVRLYGFAGLSITKIRVDTVTTRRPNGCDKIMYAQKKEGGLALGEAVTCIILREIKP